MATTRTQRNARDGSAGCIGYGFHLPAPSYAEGGQLYDPKTGRTYRGEMTSEGDSLTLRGPVGLKAFGRTEVWTRVSAPQQGCG